MITTIINGIIVDGESIVEIHTRIHNRYENEEDDSPKPRKRYRRGIDFEDDTITQIMREITSELKRG